MTVSVTEKKDLIKWLLSNRQMKIRESVWTLNYLMSHDYLMKKVHFVEDAAITPRGIVMATMDVNDEPFQFFKGGIKTTDPEKAFHDVRLNRHEDVYIELRFKDWQKNSLYVNALEENPFSKNEVLLSIQEREWMERNLNKSLEDFKVNNLKKQIDQSLDNGDKDLFMELSSKLVNCK